jgi:hypothetical protein
MRNHEAAAITEHELSQMEHRLADMIGNDTPELGDFATRGLIRVLGEVRRLARENAQLRGFATHLVNRAQSA